MATRQETSISTISTICSAAIKYKTNLVGKTFMYIFDNRFIEVIYKSENFKHMTGVESSLSAKRFYSLAVNNRLKANQISFSSRHPYNLCEKKLQHIEDLIDVTSSENFMLEEITTKNRIFKFGTTDTKFTLCLGDDLDANGNLKSKLLTVQSLRDEDCFSKAKNVHVVTHILSKPNDEKKYNKVLFVDKTSAQNGIPVIAKDLISNNILDILQ